PTDTPTNTSTPTGTPTPTSTPTPPPPPGITPTATFTPVGALCGAVGTTCHAPLTPVPDGGDSGIVLASYGPILPNGCPAPSPAGCLEFTVVGSYTLRGPIGLLNPGEVPIVRVPEARSGGGSAGFRDLVCAAAGADGTATCDLRVDVPGISPR